MMAIKEVLLQLIRVQINLLLIQEKGANSEKLGRSNIYAIGKYKEFDFHYVLLIFLVNLHGLLL